MMRNSMFDLENGDRLIHEVDLCTSKYGRWKFKEQEKTITDQEESSKKKKQLTGRDTLVYQYY